jgi:hypothetical protein
MLALAVPAVRDRAAFSEQEVVAGGVVDADTPSRTESGSCDLSELAPVPRQYRNSAADRSSFVRFSSALSEETLARRESELERETEALAAGKSELSKELERIS